MDHFILTRFNVPLWHGRLGCDLDWLSHRFKLFKQWTLPSVSSQSSKQFRWLCFFDAETPQEYLREAESWGIVEVVLIQDGPRRWKTFLQVATSAVVDRATSKWVATTRLDNDDMITWDFVELTRQNLRETEEWLTFPAGSNTHNGFYSADYCNNNTFTTLVEPRSEVSTVYSINHVDVITSQVRQGAGLRVIVSPILWCRIIHERNLSNSPRLLDLDKQLPFCDVQERFPHIAKAV